MITKKEIKEVLRDSNISNSLISIHSSYKSFGRVDGGPQIVINAFLEESCTLLAPTFSYTYMREPVELYSPKNNAWDYKNIDDDYGENRDDIFRTNSNIIDSNMGIIPKLLLNMPNRFRGDNPLDSFTAVGSRAKELVSNQTAIDLYSPFKRLIEEDGLIILMGISYDRMTLIHHCEKEVGRNMFIRWALGLDGKTIPVETGGCSSGFNNMSYRLDKLATEVKVGQSTWKVFKAIEVYNTVKNILLEEPEITKCADSICIFCRDAILGGPSYEYNII